MKEPGAECQRLLDVALPFAMRMLAASGEFFPFAVQMTPSGEIRVVATHDGREQPPSQDVIDQFVRLFAAEARDGTIEATSITYDIRIRDPKSGKSSDAIAIALDHRGNYSTIVIYPYTLVEGNLTLSDSFSIPGQGLIFPT